MKNWIKLLAMIMCRDIIPAGDGTGLRQWKSSGFLISLLPVIGIFLLLFIISFAGFCITFAGHQLEKRLIELKTSPYMALFSEGFLYSEQRSTENPTDYHNLDKWQRMTVNDIVPPSDIPGPLNQAHLFSGIFPYSNIYLDIKRKDGEHLVFQKGMALPFDGDKVDEALIKEIKNHLVQGNLPDGTGEGIILSRKGLTDFGWNYKDGHKEEIPPLLWVNISSHSSEKKEEIPLRVLGIADKLPYQAGYVISMKQMRLLNYTYYDTEITDFQLGFLDGYSPARIDDLKRELPTDAVIDEPTKKGDIDTVSITLPAPWSRTKIITQILVPQYEKRRLWMGKQETSLYGEDYKGAIFHLNPRLFDLNPQSFEKFWKDLGFLSKVQEFMDKNNAEIRGELVQALQESFYDQKNLGILKDFFQWGLLAIGLILLVLFSMVLHTRKHLIGALRMFGLPEFQFILIYAIEGVCFVLIAFGLALTTLIIFKPSGLQIQPWSLASLILLGEISLSAVLGFILPAIQFLLSLQPAEMVNYRN